MGGTSKKEEILIVGCVLAQEVSRIFDFINRYNSLEHDEDQVEKVQLVDGRGAESNVMGTLHLTTTHLIFKGDEDNKQIWVPNNLICSIERGPLSVAGSPLAIRCKHFLVIHLLLRRDKECSDLVDSLRRCSMPINMEELMAFDNRDGVEDAKGWSRLDWTIEWTRQGLDSAWKETDLNANYEICDTYPSRLWIPSNASRPILLGSANFRSKGRLPVLTYFNKASGASLCRCSQPLTGFSARCVEDERLMELIGKTNQGGGDVLLVDTRPMVNAMVNKVQGKGYEDEKNYEGLRFQFFDIENIHVMRTSQLKLVEAQSRSRSVTEYLKGVESSGWLKHTRAILECSLFIANALAKGTSCVVHCSDGWDRTSQTVSLSQLLIDPFYRTIHGFEVLIEKDWLGFGHKFDDRCGHVTPQNEEAAKEISPVFSQWLDAVWQVLRQYPRAFQFNARFLVHLHEQVYSCQFGTFLGNCEKDRMDLALSRRTKSLWTYIDSRMEDYINPYFEATLFTDLLGVSTRPSSILVFSSLYSRWEDGLLPRESVEDGLSVSIEHISVLESTVAALEARVAELKEITGRAKSAASDNSTGVVRQETQESGVFDTSLTSSEDSSGLSVRWQSLRDVTSCSIPSCTVDFGTRGEKRLHCFKCGKVCCRRCMRWDSGRERVCRACGDCSP